MSAFAENTVLIIVKVPIILAFNDGAETWALGELIVCNSKQFLIRYNMLSVIDQNFNEVLSTWSVHSNCMIIIWSLKNFR